MKKFDEYKIVYDFCDAVQNNKNITTYGRKGDLLFNSNMQNQSGEIYMVPDLNKNGIKNFINL